MLNKKSKQNKPGQISIQNGWGFQIVPHKIDFGEDGVPYFTDAWGKKQKVPESPMRPVFPVRVECYLRQLAADGNNNLPNFHQLKPQRQ